MCSSHGPASLVKGQHTDQKSGQGTRPWHTCLHKEGVAAGKLRDGQDADEHRVVGGPHLQKWGASRKGAAGAHAVREVQILVGAAPSRRERRRFVGGSSRGLQQQCGTRVVQASDPSPCKEAACAVRKAA